ncbi:huntingtin-interacting protein 1-related protein-like [Tachypleus tridentatus]|uniref:huntingtin-interacting protein 1-related protein-like n=1 Tax=Tachypleus tridentatus TaxID=6853 RepID=UPI003FD477E9
MSSLPSLPRVLSQRRANSLEVERENFVKSQILALHQNAGQADYLQGISLSKAINNQETPVKEKHVRNAIIGTFHEKGANTFWDIVMKIPLQGQPIICWKFCHVLHKL